jgi:hypothetical protein
MSDKPTPKFLPLYDLRQLVNQLLSEEITMSRMAEIINDKAEKITSLNAELLEAANDFVKRAEQGEVSVKDSYIKFKAIIEKSNQ